MITVDSKGEWKPTYDFLNKMSKGDVFRTLRRYGSEGVKALSAATPKDTGETSGSWTYEILETKGTYSIIWGNTNIVDGRPIAILIQYGHATGNGGWVVGRDYINPALRGMFDRMAEEVWREVTKK